MAHPSRKSLSPDCLLSAIRFAWSYETCDDWDPADPAHHQCGVSSLIVQDYLGGTIVRNKIGDEVVYFVRLNDGTEVFHQQTYAGQPKMFATDQPQSRGKVMRIAEEPRYRIMSHRVKDLIGGKAAPGDLQ